jgi:hypothetical protein
MPRMSRVATSGSKYTKGLIIADFADFVKALDGVFNEKMLFFKERLL